MIFGLFYILGSSFKGNRKSRYEYDRLQAIQQIKKYDGNV